MKCLARSLWQDEHGVILSTEIVIIGSVLVIGLITGMTTLQQAVNGEMQDLAGAIGSLNQSYCFSGQTSTCRYSCSPKACVAGSSYTDCEDAITEDCGDITAASSELAAAPCQTVSACVRPVCSLCGSSTCGVGYGSCVEAGFHGQPGARTIDTGVPGVKVTEWPTTSAVTTEAPCEHSTSCVPCDSKKSFINIPESVWQD